MFSLLKVVSAQLFVQKTKYVELSFLVSSDNDNDHILSLFRCDMFLIDHLTLVLLPIEFA